MRFALCSTLVLGALVGCGGEGGLVVYNGTPTVTITQPIEGAEVPEDEAIFLEGLVSDDGGLDQLSVDWIDSVSGTLIEDVEIEPNPEDNTGVVRFVTSTLEPGKHTIVLRAIDRSAEADEDTITINVMKIPEKPSIRIEHPDVAGNEKGLDGSPFVFQATVDDYQDAPEDLTVELTANPYGPVCTMTVDGNGRAECPAVLPLGPYQLEFKATDSDDNVAVANAPFAVVTRGDFDMDGDGHTPNGGDCNDSAPTMYPGAPEVCDGLDNDCNANTAIDVGTECYDDDLDGYCERPPCANTRKTIPDCDDTDPRRYPDPSVKEQVNGLDDDCDGIIDEETVVYDDDGDNHCERPPCLNATGTDSDCNDGNPRINPLEAEICGDGIDNNCNVLTNEKDAIGCTDFYYDEDGDGYGVRGAKECWCEAGAAPWTGRNPDDCYDKNARAYPGANAFVGVHRGDGKFDYNCDGAEEKEFSGRFSSCRWTFAPFSCKVNGKGWKSSEPRCGSAGTYIGDCDGTYDVICIALCAYSDPSRCTSCWSCDPDEDTETQGCR